MSAFRTALRAALLASVLLLLPATGAAAQDDVPAPVPLTSGWTFQAPGEQDFERVAVPHVFDGGAVREQDFQGGVGRYKLTFVAPEASEGFDWALRFEQVRRIATVALNGVPLTTHRDPYVPWEVTARALKPGQRNELVVRVDNRKGKEPREGWWNWGGITRPVWLVPKGRVDLVDTALLPEVTCAPGGEDCRARLLLDGTLVNRGSAPVEEPRVEVALTPPDGGEPLRSTTVGRSLAPGERTRVRHAFDVPDPQLWSPERPQRYRAATTVSVDGTTTAVDRQHVGLRSVRVVGGVLQLNGRQIDLRGASIQEDLRGRGPALSDRDIAGIVTELKTLGANVTRAHYLLNDRLLDALDAAGIMVWSQAPIYHRDRLLKTAAQRRAAVASVRGTVLAARRHPSVITHSVANELSVVPDQVPGTRAFLRDAAAVTKDLDPTLPVSVDLLSYPNYPRQETYARFDLLGINSYFGWYPGKKGRHSTARLADLGPFLDRMRRMYDRQALVITEFGAESTYAGPRRTKETYAFQTDYIRRVLDVVRDRPFMSGAIYWTLREFAVKPDWDGGALRKGIERDGIHNKGLITYGGRRKPAFALTQDLFGSTPLYREVSQAEALGMPQGSSGGGDGLLLAIIAAVLALLALDAWMVLGILRARRERRPRAGRVATERDEPSFVTS